MSTTSKSSERRDDTRKRDDIRKPSTGVTNSNDPKLLNARIFIGNVPSEKVTKFDVEERFQKYGKIIGVSLHRGFAFVQYENKADAEAAVKEEHGALLKNFKIDVNLASLRRREPGREREQTRDREQARDRDQVRDRESEDRNRGGRRNSPALNDRKRDYRERSPHRETDSDDRSKRPFVREDRFRDDRLKEPYGDSFRRRFEDEAIARRFDSVRDEAYKARRDLLTSPFRENFKDNPTDVFDPHHPNDCEIIVPSKMQRSYAEVVEHRLRNLGLRVDILFPREETPMPQILEDISRRGCLYAIVITAQHEQHASVTLNILWGTPQEHRNMPLDDALNLIAQSFEKYLQSVREKLPLSTSVSRRSDQGFVPFPAAEGSIQVLLNLLADGRPLSILELDKVIRYLQERKQRQLEPENSAVPVIPNVPAVSSVPTPAVAPILPTASSTILPVGGVMGSSTKQQKPVSDHQAELQKRILSILNNTSAPNNSVIPGNSISSNWTPAATTPQQNNNPATVINFDNPSVQKALDNLIQTGPNLLRSLQVASTGLNNSASNSSVSMQMQNAALSQQRHPLLGTLMRNVPGMGGWK